MAANLWWRDVLENGRASEYADFFDIDWNPLKPELRNKVLLPILGNQYGEELESRAHRAGFDEPAFRVEYFDKVLPDRSADHSTDFSFRWSELRQPGRCGIASCFLLAALPSCRRTPLPIRSVLAPAARGSLLLRRFRNWCSAPSRRASIVRGPCGG